MITYKTISPENLETFLNDPKNLKNIFDIVNQKKPSVKKYTPQQLFFFKRDLLKDRRYIFLGYEKNSLVGFCTGYVLNDIFNITHLYVKKGKQDLNIGKKLKIRAISYLLSKEKIKRFTSLNVVDNKVYSINKAIVERKNKSSSRKYILESSGNKFLDKNKKSSPKGKTIIIKRAGKK